MVVLLEDFTVGTTESAKVGDHVEVTLCDENGNFIKKSGVVVEILEGDIL